MADALRTGLRLGADFQSLPETKNKHRRVLGKRLLPSFALPLIFIISCALLLVIAGRRKCDCAKTETTVDRDIRVDSAAANLSNVPSQRGSGIPGPSWDLPATFSSLFPRGRRVDPSNFRLHLKVLIYDRTDSGLRCVRALENALYDGDPVDLDIFVDHTFDEGHDTWAGESHSRIDTSHDLLSKLETSTWSHGQMRVHYRARNGGMQAQWLEAWWPLSVNDFAFIVEDDIEVSPMFYRYFKHAVAQYYYNATNFNPLVFGISFQRQYLVPGFGGQPMVRGSEPFLYMLIGTWGQLWFPSGWKEFRRWYDRHRYNGSEPPDITGMETTNFWYVKGNKIWDPWFVKFSHARGLFTLYPSFPGDLALSVNHREVGVDFRSHLGADAGLLSAKHFEDASFDWWAAPPMRTLKKYDFCFREVPHHEPAGTGGELKALLERIHQGRAVALIVVPPNSALILRNWLCHIDGLNLTNYILVVDDAEQAEDLALRGHPVYLLGLGPSQVARLQPQPDATWQDQEQGAWEPSWSGDHLELALSALSLGYNVLLANPDTVWHADPFRRLGSEEFDVEGVLDESSLSNSFLYLRGTPATMAVVKRLRQLVEAAKGRKLADLAKEAARLMREAVKFRQIATTQVAKLEAANLGNGEVPVVLVPHADSVEEKTAKMKEAGVWVLDYDLACKAVVCHKKVPPF